MDAFVPSSLMISPTSLSWPTRTYRFDPRHEFSPCVIMRPRIMTDVPARTWLRHACSRQSPLHKTAATVSIKHPMTYPSQRMGEREAFSVSSRGPILLHGSFKKEGHSHGWTKIWADREHGKGGPSRQGGREAESYWRCTYAGRRPCTRSHSPTPSRCLRRRGPSSLW